MVKNIHVGLLALESDMSEHIAISHTITSKHSFIQIKSMQCMSTRNTTLDLNVTTAVSIRLVVVI